MAEHEHNFSPDHIDEQLQQPRDFLSHEEARLTQDLYQSYQAFAEENTHSLEHAWERIDQRRQQALSNNRSNYLQITTSQRELHQGRMTYMSNANPRRARLQRTISIIAAILFLSLLIGSMLAVFNAMKNRNTNTAHSGKAQTTTSQTVTVTIPSTKPSPGIYMISDKDAFTNQVSKLDLTTHALLWKQSEEATSSIVVVGDGVYGTSADGMSGNNKYVYALDANTGKERWRASFAPDTSTPPNFQGSPSDLDYMTTPTVADGIVYVSARSGKVTALRATDGKVLWTYDAQAIAYVDGTMYDSTQPVVVNGVLYGATHNKLFALDAKNGTQRWSISIANEQIFNGAQVVNNVIYISSYVESQHQGGTWMNGGVYAFSASKGTKLWTHPVSNWVLSSPTVVNGIVYFGSYDQNIYALKASNGAVLWHYNTGGHIYDAPLVSNGMVYVDEVGNASEASTAPNTVAPAQFALNANNGKLIWKQLVAGSPQGILNGVLYVSVFPRLLYTLNANTGAIISHHTYGTNLSNKTGTSDGIAPYVVIIP